MGFPKPWPTEWPVPNQNPKPEFPPQKEAEQTPPLRPGTEPPFPIPEYRRRFRAVTWAVNHACNLQCTHCYDVVPFRRTDLNTLQALALIDRLQEAGVEFIAFSGGEAFLRKDLFQLMEHSRKRGIQIGARSNGTRITLDEARKLKVLEACVVGVSFDGACEETHDRVRGKGAFRSALAGIEALIAAGVRTQLEVVLSRQNLHEALDFILLGETIGASEVNFSALTPNGRGRQRVEDLLDFPTWSRVTATLREASRIATIPVTPNCALAGPCVANIEPHVTCDGWMSPCYLSTVKLFSVLETPAPEIRRLLERDQQMFQDICGRKAWLHGTPPDRDIIPLTAL